MVGTQSVIEIIGRTQSGITRPFQCRLDDDQVYAVKGRDALPRGLIAELIAAHLGREIGLPIPPFLIAEVSPALVAATEDPVFASSIEPGLGFASLWQEPIADLTRSAISDFAPELLARVLVFDHWIRNGDRTLTELGGNANLFVKLDTNSLVVIDHNLAFSPHHDSTDLEVHACREAWLETKRNMLFRLEMTETCVRARDSLDELILDIPGEWTENEPGMVDQVRDTLSRIELDEFWEELP